MSSNKKRKYGDLSARPIPVTDPSLLEDVFQAFTGRKPDPPAPENSRGGDFQSGGQAVRPRESPRSDGKVIQQTAAAPHQIVPPSGIPHSGIPEPGTLEVSTGQISSKGGFLAILNDVVDGVLPTLEPIEQVVLLRLYRLTRGFQKETCDIGFGALAKQCNIARSRAQESVKKLIALGHVQQLSTGKQQGGNTYKINLPGVPKRGIPESGIPQPGVHEQGAFTSDAGMARSNASRPHTSGPSTSDTPRDGIPDLGIPQRDGGIPRGGIVPPGGIPQGGRNKEIENKKIQNNTHTHTQSVGACRSATGGGKSAYPYDLWLEYAKYEQKREPGMISPKAVAIKAFETGERDFLMPAYLADKDEAQKPKKDISTCPTCSGTGWEQIEGKGVRPCKHPLLEHAE